MRIDIGLPNLVIDAAASLPLVILSGCGSNRGSTKTAVDVEQRTPWEVSNTEILFATATCVTLLVPKCCFCVVGRTFMFSAPTHNCPEKALPRKPAF